MNYTELFTEKYRPTELDEMVLDPTIRSYFESILSAENPTIPNLILYGKPGGGKTTLARILSKKLGWETLELNASDENGVDTIRDKVATFCSTASLYGDKKLVIFEEADGLSSAGGNGSSAQQMLKNLIEESSDTVRFIMTANDFSKFDAAIKSRMDCRYICPPKGSDNMYKAIARRLNTICRAEGITFDFDKEVGITSTPIYRIAKTCYPDMRKAVDCVQRYSFNKEKKLVYDIEENNTVSDVAKYVVNYLIDTFSGSKPNIQSIVDLRASIIQREDDFGSDYHALMREMLMLFIDVQTSDSFSQNDKMEVVLEIQDRMKWYTQVLDKELHMFAMLVSVAKILTHT